MNYWLKVNQQIDNKIKCSNKRYHLLTEIFYVCLCTVHINIFHYTIWINLHKPYIRATGTNVLSAINSKECKITFPRRCAVCHFHISILLEKFSTDVRTYYIIIYSNSCLLSISKRKKIRVLIYLYVPRVNAKKKMERNSHVVCLSVIRTKFSVFLVTHHIPLIRKYGKMHSFNNWYGHTFARIRIHDKIKCAWHTFVISQTCVYQLFLNIQALLCPWSTICYIYIWNICIAIPHIHKICVPKYVLL